MGMNYLRLLEMSDAGKRGIQELNFLVSGSDKRVSHAIQGEIFGRCCQAGYRIIILDDSNQAFDVSQVMAAGYRIRDGLSQGICLYDPFKSMDLHGTAILRQILTTLEYREADKAKLFSYLGFLRFIFELETGTSEELTVDIILQYCSTMAVEDRLQWLVNAGKINESYRQTLLAKYSECMTAGADLENMIYVLHPFIKGLPLFSGGSEPEAVVLRLNELGEDETLKNLILQFLQFRLEDERQENRMALIIADRGYGNRDYLLKMLNRLPAFISTHMFTDDVFTLGEEAMLSVVFNRFNVRIFSRHPTMASAETLERTLGQVDIVRTTQSVSRDRRWRAYSPMDILFNRNKTETVTQLAPVREPRYRKEMIRGLSPGYGIIDFDGETSQFSI